MIFDDILAQVSKKFQSSKMNNNNNNNNINSQCQQTNLVRLGGNCAGVGSNYQQKLNNPNKMNNLCENSNNNCCSNKNNGNNCRSNNSCSMNSNNSNTSSCSGSNCIPKPCSPPGSRLIASICEGPNCPNNNNNNNNNNNTNNNNPRQCGSNGTRSACCIKNEKQCLLGTCLQNNNNNNTNCLNRCNHGRICHHNNSNLNNNNNRSCSAQMANRVIKNNCNGSHCLC
jgi:hypothetical protein